MHHSCRTLRSAVPPPGVVACIGEPGFASEATLFNRNLQDERAPLAIVKPSSLSQLQAVLETARASKLRVSVRNGGHNPSGRALSKGGVTIDLGRHRAIRIVRNDASGPVAEVGAGAVWGDVYEALGGSGLYAVGGGCPMVGVAGLVMNGGIAFTSRKRGLVGDSVLSFTLVFPNGTVAETEGGRSALRSALSAGGGSTLGVVWALRLRLWPAPEGGHGVGVVRLGWKGRVPMSMLPLAAAAMDANVAATDDDEGWSLNLVVGREYVVWHHFHEGSAEVRSPTSRALALRVECAGPAPARVWAWRCEGCPGPCPTTLCEWRGVPSLASPLGEPRFWQPARRLRPARKLHARRARHGSFARGASQLVRRRRQPCTTGAAPTRDGGI